MYTECHSLKVYGVLLLYIECILGLVTLLNKAVFLLLCPLYSRLSRVLSYMSTLCFIITSATCRLLYNTHLRTDITLAS